MSKGNSQERKYKRGQFLKPISENMFWESYKIIGYPSCGSKGISRRKLGYSYLLECTPKNNNIFSKTIIQVNESSISSLMEVNQKEDE